MIVYDPFEEYECDVIGLEAFSDDVPSPKLQENETIRESSVELLASNEQ